MAVGTEKYLKLNECFNIFRLINFIDDRRIEGIRNQFQTVLYFFAVNTNEIMEILKPSLAILLFLKAGGKEEMRRS